MQMRRLLITLLLAVGVASLNAQSAINGFGMYGTTPTAMLNGGAGYGATAYAPASFTLTGYNATGLTPGSTTYTSGITATGTVTQTCTLTFSSSGSPTTAAVGTVRLSTTNTVAAGSVVTFTTVGTGYGSTPTTAVASNGTATCSGTVAVSAHLGAYAPFAVDAAGNLSAGALLGYAIPTLAAGCLQSAGTTGPLSWAACGSGSGLSGMTQYGLSYAASATTITSSVQPASWTTGHTFVPAWQPSGSALAPISLDLATYLASPPAIGGTAPAAGNFTNVAASTGVLTNAEYDNGTCTTSKAISAANGNHQKVLLTNAQTCALTFVQPTSPYTMTITLKITQSAAGSFNGLISTTATCKWPGGAVPTITATTGAIDFVTFYLDGSGCYGVAGQNFQ